MKSRIQHFYWSSIILVVFGGASGCSKPGASLNVNPVSYVSILNLAAYGGAVDIFFNGSQVSQTSGILPGQFSTQYGQLKPGSYVIDFRKHGTDSLLFELPAVTYDTSTFYTLLIYNTTADTSLNATRIQDDFSQINTNNAFYRFFNESPDASSVGLYMNSTVVQTSRTPADNITNTSLDQFVPVTPQAYTLKVENGSDSVLASTSTYPFAAGSVYTIFLTGTKKSGFSLTVLPVVF